MLRRLLMKLINVEETCNEINQTKEIAFQMLFGI